jgi:hypothetical protein
MATPPGTCKPMYMELGCYTSAVGAAPRNVQIWTEVGYNAAGTAIIASVRYTDSAGVIIPGANATNVIPGACCCSTVQLTDCAGVPIPSTTPLLTRNAAASAGTVLGGATPASRAFWTFPLDGLTCPSVLKSPVDACTNAAYPASSLLIGALADGTVGWVKPVATPQLAQKSITAAYAVNLQTDNIIFANANASSYTVTVPTPVATNLCERHQVVIKRTDNNPLQYVRVAASAIDGAPGNTIQLGTSSAFGTQTGESATLQWDIAAATWRVI